ncbi:MAG: hypothetical protein ACREQP_09660, partial [Candidatus Binatia bacterium]
TRMLLRTVTCPHFRNVKEFGARSDGVSDDTGGNSKTHQRSSGRGHRLFSGRNLHGLELRREKTF